MVKTKINCHVSEPSVIDSIVARDGTDVSQVAYGYDVENRLATISATNAQGRGFSLAYSYNGSYGTGCTLTTPTNAVIGAALTRDPYRRRQVTDVVTAFNGLEITVHSYAFDGLGRVTNAVRSIRPLALASTNAYAYNARSEVVGALIETNDYAYIYDSLGNNLYTSLNAETNAYTVNNLNQYTSISNFVSFAPSCEINPHYDADGNMVRLANHILAYDAENRLATYTFGVGYATGTLRSAYVYDHLGRRISKMGQERRVKNPGGIVPLTYWHTNTVTTFVYDGWNLIYERVAYTNGTVDEVKYVWGLDLSGSLQGAGGVGGLLYEKRNGNIFIPCYDANGNITAYVDTNGLVRAYRHYDAFGNTVAKGGDMVDVLHFWYSTKYLDHDTGLYYYGYRYYSSLLQRWINRDPIEENDEVNLYGFVRNNSVTWWDYLGMLTNEQYKEKIIWSAETQYRATYWMLVPQWVPVRTIYFQAFPQVLPGAASNRRNNDDAPKTAFNASHLTIRKLTVYAKPKTLIEYDKNGRELYEPGIAIVPKGSSPDNKWEYPWSQGSMALNALTGMSAIGSPVFDTSPQSTIKKWSDYYLDVNSVGFYEIHRKIRTCKGDDIVLPTWIFELKDTKVVKRPLSL
jgi:RHS repeat-associated protein